LMMLAAKTMKTTRLISVNAMRLRFIHWCGYS
jgi:hypothetical protein